MDNSREYDFKKFEINFNFAMREVEIIEDNIYVKHNILITIKSKNEDIGQITIELEAIINFDDNDEIIKFWEKNKKLPDDVESHVFNRFFAEIMPIISLVLQKMNLPVPIPSPFFSQEVEDDGNNQKVDD